MMGYMGLLYFICPCCVLPHGIADYHSHTQPGSGPGSYMLSAAHSLVNGHRKAVCQRRLNKREPEGARDSPEQSGGSRGTRHRLLS